MQADQRIVVKDYTAGQIAAMKRKLATSEEENQIFRRSGCGTSATIDEKISAVEVFHLGQKLIDLRNFPTAVGSLAVLHQTVDFVQNKIACSASA